MTTVSPPPTTDGAEPATDGKANWLKPETAFSLVVATPGTKSPSMTIAALGGSVKTLFTEVGKSVCSAPEVPPKMLPDALKTCAIVFSELITDGSVHLIAWVESWSYFAAPAWRRSMV